MRQIAIEDFELEPGAAPYDLAVAIRVGVWMAVTLKGNGKHVAGSRRR